MTLPHDALVLVADGRKALFLRNRGDEQRIDLRTASHRTREDRKDSDIKTDAAGQSPAPVEPAFPAARWANPISTSKKRTASRTISLKRSMQWRSTANSTRSSSWRRRVP